MRKRLVVLLMAVMMLVMSAAPAMAHHDVGHININQGHQDDDNADRDQGGGNNHIKQNQGKGND